MRILTGSLAVCVVVVSLAACLPAQRPDANFVVRTCSDAPAGVAKHNECLYFDASDSHSFSGKAKFSWSATATWVTNGNTVVTANLADFAAAAGSASVTPKKVWFARELHPLTTVTVKLEVRDREGLTRAATRNLVLTNSPPSFTGGASFIRARSSDVILSPFAVIHLPITDEEGDSQALDVTQLVPTPGPFNSLQVVRCSEVPTRLAGGFPDLSDGDSNALCVTIQPLDDLTTPGVDESACSATNLAVAPCLAAPLFDKDPRDFQLRVKVREEGVEPPETTPGTNCVPRVDAQGIPIEVVGCVTLRVGDVLWTASSTSVAAGEITRVASGWRRGRPTGVVVRNGRGATEDPSGNVVLAGNLDFCSLQAFCPGALVKFAPDMSFGTLAGLGQIEDLRYVGAGPGGIPGYWISAFSLDSNGNPGARAGGPVIPAGIPYDVFVPALVLQTNQAGDLSFVSASAFAYLTGLAQADGTVEIPHALAPAADNALWVATSAYCPHYDANAGMCKGANAGLPARIVRRLRRVAPGTPALGTSVNVGTLANVEPAPTLVPPGYGQPLETIAADGLGGIYALTADATVSPPASKIYHLNSAGTVDRTPLSAPARYFAGIARSVGANGKDRLWIADSVTASLNRIEDPAGNASLTTVPGQFTLPQAFAFDGAGNLWVDDRLNSFTRRIVAVARDASGIAELEPFSSTGRGLALGSAIESGAWHGDSLDAVRQPLGDSREVPAHTEGPIGSTLAGLDPTDGGVYGFSPYVENATNVFRVETDGTFEPLLALASLGTGTVDAPACGAVQPGLPPKVLNTASAATASLLWLCLPAPTGSGWRFSAIDLARLRRAGRAGLPPATHLDPCTATTLPETICEEFEVAARDPSSGAAFVPRHAAFSLGDFALWVHGDAGGHDVLYPIIDPLLFGSTGAPFFAPGLDLGAGAVPASAVAPLAGAFDPIGTTGMSNGGAWLLLSDDSIGRIMFTGNPPAVTRVPALSVPRPTGIPSTVHPTAVANELVSNAVWRTWDTGSSAIVDRTYVDVPGKTVTPCGKAMVVPTRGQAIAIESFTRTDQGFFGTAWLSGDGDDLVRVRAPYTPAWQPGHCGDPMTIDYVHRPDTIGSSVLNPGGRSLTGGGS